MQHTRKGNFKFATDSIGIRRLEKQGYEVVEVIREGFVSEAEWSQKYKDSIDCDNPKGFSQRLTAKVRKRKPKRSKSATVVVMIA